MTWVGLFFLDSPLCLSMNHEIVAPKWISSVEVYGVVLHTRAVTSLHRGLKLSPQQLVSGENTWEPGGAGWSELTWVGRFYGVTST